MLGIGAASSLAVVVAPPDARSLLALPLFVVALVVVWRQTRRLPPKARHAFTYFCAATNLYDTSCSCRLPDPKLEPGSPAWDAAAAETLAHHAAALV